MGRENERIYCEGGPLVVTVDGNHVRLTITDVKNPDSYFFIKVPVADGSRVVKDIQDCLYSIITTENEN